MNFSGFFGDFFGKIPPNGHKNEKKKIISRKTPTPVAIRGQVWYNKGI